MSKEAISVALLKAVQPTDQEIVDNLQMVREQIARLQEEEKSYANMLKAKGLGIYAGSIADCSVTEIETTRVNVEKVVKKLNIAPHIFDKFYTIKSTTKRAKIVSKKFAKVGV